MPNWNEVLEEIENSKRVDRFDYIRRKYLKALFDITGRNVIAYYSGWLQKPGLNQTSIDDDDKNGFMAVVHKLDRTKGLDLILHTPGGDLAATESLVDYLKRMFGNNIRAIVPQIAMSAGTMIACSCREIIMGKQSNLGPIDPQLGGIPALGVIEEFNRAIREVEEFPERIPIWQVIISRYHPTFVGECENAIAWSREIALKWLQENMLKKCPYKAEKVIERLADYQATKSHARHINIDECIDSGLEIIKLEEYLGDRNLQDIVLTVHHAYMLTLSQTPAAKIIENHNGVAMVRLISQMSDVPQ